MQDNLTFLYIDINRLEILNKPTCMHILPNRFGNNVIKCNAFLNKNMYLSSSYGVLHCMTRSNCSN